MKYIYTSYCKDKAIHVDIFDNRDEAIEFFEEGIAVDDSECEHSTLISIVGIEDNDDVGDVGEVIEELNSKDTITCLLKNKLIRLEKSCIEIDLCELELSDLLMPLLDFDFFIVYRKDLNEWVVQCIPEDNNAVGDVVPVEDIIDIIHANGECTLDNFNIIAIQS